MRHEVWMWHKPASSSAFFSLSLCLNLSAVLLWFFALHGVHNTAPIAQSFVYMHKSKICNPIGMNYFA